MRRVACPRCQHTFETTKKPRCPECGYGKRQGNGALVAVLVVAVSLLLGGAGFATWWFLEGDGPEDAGRSVPAAATSAPSEVPTKTPPDPAWQALVDGATELPVFEDKRPAWVAYMGYAPCASWVNVVAAPEAGADRHFWATFRLDGEVIGERPFGPRFEEGLCLDRPVEVVLAEADEQYEVALVAVECDDATEIRYADVEVPASGPPTVSARCQARETGRGGADGEAQELAPGAEVPRRLGCLAVFSDVVSDGRVEADLDMTLGMDGQIVATTRLFVEEIWQVERRSGVEFCYAGKTAQIVVEGLETPAVIDVPKRPCDSLSLTLYLDAGADAFVNLYCREPGSSTCVEVAGRLDAARAEGRKFDVRLEVAGSTADEVTAEGGTAPELARPYEGGLASAYCASGQVTVMVGGDGEARSEFDVDACQMAAFYVVEVRGDAAPTIKWSCDM